MLLVNIFWRRTKIKPNPNSIAEKTKKKKVRDNKFKLLSKRPKDSVMT